jgi:glycosyltransferase involved in cell wall biosynthesis
MKIALITDAWFPQVNGVVRTFSTTMEKCREAGHETHVISPDAFKTIPCPTYPEIRLSLFPRKKLTQKLDEFAPDAIHIATEGPLGLAARRYCMKRSYPFTTAYATRFPEYIYARSFIPVRFTYALYRWFHKPSSAIMVSTPRLKQEMEDKGFQNLAVWARGVDVDLFKPRDKSFLEYTRPVLIYVGRVAIEKNIHAFLKLKHKGTKVVVGDGPQRAALQKKYPDVVFVGAKKGEELARHYAAADVFIFPSLTDTFGLVMLEALASGVPVAAFPVAGPVDVITDDAVGVLNDNLEIAVEHALLLKPDNCRAFALDYSWENVAQLFLSLLQPITR